MTRKLPLLTPDNAPFWQGGKDGQLLIQHCDNCDRWQHPPGPLCRDCGGDNLDFRPVTGRGQILSYTINHQKWTPDLEVPNIIAIVELQEQAGLRFTTNIVACPVDEVRIGMPVRVTFLQQDDVWIPLFERDL